MRPWGLSKHMNKFDCRDRSGYFRSWRQLVGVARALTLLVFLPIAAQGDLPVNDSHRPAVSVPKTTLKPLLTAQPDDPAWSKAVALPEMTPSLGAPAFSAPYIKTSVSLMWDPAYLYVRFVCKDQEIYTPVHGHDAPIYQGDAVEIFIDPVGDARQWIELEFNADNDVFDQLYILTAEPKTNKSLALLDEVFDRDLWQFLSWDMKDLISKGSRLTPAANEQGWIVDVAIPAKELLRRTGLKQFKAMTLRGDFMRYKWLPSAASAKRDFIPFNWSPVILGCPHYSPTAYGFINLVE